VEPIEAFYYDLPEYYDIVFSFIDHKHNTNFVIEACAEVGMERIGSMVDLGCGPGMYCLEFARKGIRSVGLDLSRHALDYTTKKAQAEGLDCSVLRSDFRNFQLDEPVDLAICMTLTFQHNLDNADFIASLNAVAKNLKKGGIFFLEIEHPKTFFDFVFDGVDEKGYRILDKSIVADPWKSVRGDTVIYANWLGAPVLDTINSVCYCYTEYVVYKGDEEPKTYRSPAHYKMISLEHLMALVEISGEFELAATYGAFDINVPFADIEESHKLMVLLRKK